MIKMFKTTAKFISLDKGGVTLEAAAASTIFKPNTFPPMSIR
jgi:hypothetical protein